MKMKSITVSPLLAWALAQDHTQYLPYNRRTPYRGEILIGSGALTEGDVNRYTDYWKLGMLGRAGKFTQHPVEWGGSVPQHAFVAVGKLVDIAPFDSVLLPIFELLSFPKARLMLVFEDVQKLDPPVYARQDTGIRDYDLKALQPLRYYPLTPEQVDDLYGLCEYVEKIGNGNADSDGDTTYAMIAQHFIVLPAYEKTRAQLFRMSSGRYLLRRRSWRNRFKKLFPDYAPEAA